jgi:hypothetical protein
MAAICTIASADFFAMIVGGFISIEILLGRVIN